jgi:hypothetical protein
MRNFKSSLGIFSLVSAASIALACGGSSKSNPRQALTVTVTPATATAAANGQIQFTAAGTFSSPPTMESPVQANWVVLNSDDSPTTAVTITSSGLAQCTSAAAGAYNVGAWIVQFSGNPPTPICNVISAYGNPCGDSVLGTAQLTCP